LFDVYVGESTALSSPSTPASPETNTARPTFNRSKDVPKQALDELVRDATSSQLKQVNKRRLQQLRKDYEDEAKKSDPSLLAGKSLEVQNQRLTTELKRAEKMLNELNRDHCELAGASFRFRLTR
jgi:hypothetical protein